MASKSFVVQNFTIAVRSRIYCMYDAVNYFFKPGNVACASVDVGRPYTVCILYISQKGERGALDFLFSAYANLFEKICISTDCILVFAS
jgi:hypothetical protein